MTNHQPAEGADDELTQAERIRRLMHRCDKEAEHVAELKDLVRTIALERDAAREFVARLLAERDEARRKLCDIFANEVRHRIPTTELYPGSNHNARVRVAEDLGWDCFKEDGK